MSTRENICLIARAHLLELDRRTMDMNLWTMMKIEDLLAN